MKTTRGIRIKVQVNQEQKQMLRQTLGIKRFIWNTALAYKIDLWETYKRRNPCVDNVEEKKLIIKMGSNRQIQKVFAKKEIAKYPGLEFLSLIRSRSMQQALNDLDKAFKNFFDPKLKKGYPKFKKKSKKQSIRFLEGLKLRKTNKKNVEITIGKMIFKGINPDRENIQLFNSKINNITLSIDNLDNVYASINYSYESTPDNTKLTYNDSMVGIDVGITDSVVTSQGELCNIPEKLKKIELKKKKLQKRNANRNLGSRSYLKTKRQITKIYHKQSNVREDFHHKLSDSLTKNHGLIVREDLKIKNMSRSAKGTLANPGKNVAQKSGLNREILNQSWGMFFQFLEYKGFERGVEVIKVAPQGTSQTCSKCDHRDPKSRKGKKFICTNCGMEMDADINGAINILTRGQRGIAGREDLISASAKNQASTTPELEKTPLE